MTYLDTSGEPPHYICSFTTLFNFVCVSLHAGDIFAYMYIKHNVLELQYIWGGD